LKVEVEEIEVEKMEVEKWIKKNTGYILTLGLLNLWHLCCAQLV